MRRRGFLVSTAAAWLAGAGVRAQAVPRIGYITAGDIEPGWTLFRKAMAELGYVDGRTVAIEFRNADAASGRLEGLMAELVALRVDVIVAVLSPAIAAAKRATSSIPIVFNGAAPDAGLADNVARPAGNMTGVFSPSSTVAAKGLQLFKEIKPATKSFGVLLNAPDPFHVPLKREIELVAEKENIALVTMLIKSDALADTIQAMAGRGVDGVLIQPSLGLEAAASLALRYRVPAISFRREFVEAGGLMAYGPNQAEMNRMVAQQVDKLLKGAKPASLPLQQASQFDLVVNQKTARAIGLAIPSIFLARVDEVLE